MDTGYFCILAIVTSATMIMTVNLSDILIYFSLNIDIIGGLLDHAVVLFFFLRNFYAVLHNGYTNLHYHQQCARTHFFSHSN